MTSPRFRLFASLTAALSSALSVLNGELISGPMLGPVEMREAKIWVQTEGPALVRVAYAEGGQEDTMKWSMPVETDGNMAHTATIRLSQVEPGIDYRYRIEVNGELIDGTHQFTTPTFYHGRTPPPDFSIAIGGGHYATEEGFEPPYQTLGRGYEIFNTIHDLDPRLMIWLGNTAHLRASDYGSQSGYLKRFSTARSVEQMNRFLANVPQYATWSATDYGWPGADNQYAYREDAEAAFRAFWPRPTNVRGLEGIATQFRYADVDFFLLDTRSHRNTEPSVNQSLQILGPDQVEWLRKALIQSTATFKIVATGSPILNPADNPSNLSYAGSEHTELLQIFRDESIKGLFFISGGKDFGELTRLVHANGYNLFDLTLGPLTATPADTQEELNFFRMPGTSVFQRHFATLDFSGPEDARELTVSVIDTEGTTLWTRTIGALELQLPDSDD